MMSAPVPSPVAPEQPLPALRYGLYLLFATLLIAGFYLYCVVAMVLCTAIGLAACLIVLGILRSGALVGHLLGSFGGVLWAFGRSLYLGRDGADFGVPVSREEAPQLWAIVEDLSGRLGVSPPQEVTLENGVNAWVLLKGVRAGRGQTRLGIGFDLLTGLSPAQTRAVLAHEMAHAKHVKRGYQGFLLKGLVRAERCSVTLQSIAKDRDNLVAGRGVAAVMGAIPRWIGHITGRLVAACSRYDEFLADRIAGEICGSHITSRALLETHVLALQAQNINWRERVLHLERAPGYSAWLSANLRIDDDANRLELENKAIALADRDEMSSHPTLSDRMAALESAAAPGDGQIFDGLQSGVNLLKSPDETGKKLVRAVEKVVTDEEHKATQSLAKMVQKQGSRSDTERSRRIYTWSIVGLGLILLAPLTVIVPEGGWTPGVFLGILVWLGIVGAAAWFYYQSGANPILLPVPSLVAYRTANLRRQEESRAEYERHQVGKGLTAPEKLELNKVKEAAAAERDRKLAVKLRELQPLETKDSKSNARYWAEEGAGHLRRCEYAEAAVCARESLSADPRQPVAQLIMAICGAYHQDLATYASIDGAFKKSQNFTGRWAMAWATSLAGQAELSEPYLLESTRHDPGNATLWALLADCQDENGRPREALHSRRQGLQCALNSRKSDDEACHRFALAESLTALGLLGEAKTEFEWLQQKRQGDSALPGLQDFTVDAAWIGWNVANGEAETALELADKFAANYEAAHQRIALADALIDSRVPETAAAARTQYEQLLEKGFYPQAKLGLFKIAYDGGDKVEARRLLLETLDMTQPDPFDAIIPFSLLEIVLVNLRELPEMAPRKVTLFEVYLNAQDTPLDIKRISFFCLHESGNEARLMASEIFQALLPGYDLESRVAFRRGVEESQPTGPLPPGIYHVALEE